MPSHRLAIAAVLGFALTPAAQPPAPIARLSMGLRTAPQQSVMLDVACSALRDATQNPLVLWATDATKPLAPPRERDGAAAWLGEHAAALGFTGFTPAFARQETWHGCDVWVYQLTRDGARLFDAEVSLYWEGTTCVGVLNRTPKIARLPADGAARPANAVLCAPRAADGATDGEVVWAELRQSQTERHDVTEVLVGTQVVHRILEQRVWTAAPQVASITEYTFPGMNFPDQIWADSKGLIWFSEPSANRVSVFDPTTSQFRSFPATGYGGCDGLQVDNQDRVWFGLYNSGNGLGMIDARTGVFTRYPPPVYANQQLAIPTDSGRGTIYVTDHIAERISEFDPKTATWLRTVVMPAPSYPVGGTLEAETNDLWLPLYFFHGVGRLSPGGTTVTRFAAPSQGGPAFVGVHDGKVYYTNWLTNRLGVFDIRSSSFSEFAWRVGETGGPIAIAPNGHAVVGTRNRGYIAVFDPVAQTFVDYLIPTANSGLKDGLTVAPDGVVWFTLTIGPNKIAKLVLP
jgi:streptogramin lyase